MASDKKSKRKNAELPLCKSCNGKVKEPEWVECEECGYVLCAGCLATARIGKDKLKRIKAIDCSNEKKIHLYCVHSDDEDDKSYTLTEEDSSDSSTENLNDVDGVPKSLIFSFKLPKK
jgi:hypothetical protein